MSVPDLFMARAGAAAMVDQFTFAAGMRVEALPSTDLIGGGRRIHEGPVILYRLSTGITYVAKKVSINLAVPVAVKGTARKAMRTKGRRPIPAFTNKVMQPSLTTRSVLALQLRL